MKELSLPVESLPMLLRSTAEAFNLGELGWPYVWQSSDAARAAIARLGDASVEFFVLELGVPSSAVARLVRELTPRAGERQSGFLSKLKSARPTEFNATPLGWEVLGAETDGSFHSWLCNSIQNDASTRLNIQPGIFGLLTGQPDANAVVALLDGGLGANRSLGLAVCSAACSKLHLTS